MADESRPSGFVFTTGSGIDSASGVRPIASRDEGRAISLGHGDEGRMRRSSIGGSPSDELGSLLCCDL